MRMNIWSNFFTELYNYLSAYLYHFWWATETILTKHTPTQPLLHFKNPTWKRGSEAALWAPPTATLKNDGDRCQEQ